jgi:hypothetical protein
VILCRGDITKRDEIAWGFNLSDAAPFIEHLERDLMFREAVIGFFTGGDSKTPEEKARKEYCETCKRLKPDADCAACSQKIEVTQCLPTQKS